MATPTVPWPRGIVRAQRDGVVWWGWSGGGPTGGAWGEWGRSEGEAGGGRGWGGGTHGEKKKSYGKHLANGLKHADNTTEIKGEAETRRPLLKQMAAGVFCFFFSFGAEIKRKERHLSFAGGKFSACKSNSRRKNFCFFFLLPPVSSQI